MALGGTSNIPPVPVSLFVQHSGYTSAGVPVPLPTRTWFCAVPRYPHEFLSLISTPSWNMLWAHHTLWIPVYPLAVLAEGTPVSRPLSPVQTPSGTAIKQQN